VVAAAAAVAAVVPAVALLLVPAVVALLLVPVVALLLVPVVALLLVPVVKSPVARARPLDRSLKTGVRSSQTPVSHDRTWPGLCPHQSLFCALPRPSCRLRVLAVALLLVPAVALLVVPAVALLVVPRESASFCETRSWRPTRVRMRLESQSRPCRLCQTQRARGCTRCAWHYGTAPSSCSHWVATN
jgi:hypothetical protein